MSTSDPRPPGDDPAQPTGRPTEKGKRWRILIPLIILLVVVGIFTYILVVSQRGTDDDSEEQETNSAPIAVLIQPPASMTFAA